MDQSPTPHATVPDDIDASTLVRSVRSPVADVLESRRLLWITSGVCLLVAGFTSDALLGAHYRIAFDGGDVLRELEALGQWGQLSSLVIVGILVCRLQPDRWRRILDLGLAAGLVSLAVLVLKLLIGRVRPRHESPFAFDGWLVRIGDVPESLSGYDLASMPSSHTSAAVVLSIFVAVLWPRLLWFAMVMALLVAFTRVVFVAHWMSDVVLGGLIALLVVPPVISGFWGVRLVDALWIRLVDRGAEPALPRVVAAERRRLDASLT